MAQHARLGCSNERWRYCAGSVKAEEPYPDSSSPAAIDGTGSHLLLELCLLQGVVANSFAGQTIGVGHEDEPMGWNVQPDRVARVQLALDYVHRRVKELTKQFPGADVEVFAEAKSYPGKLYDRADWWGTCDIFISVHEAEVTHFAEVIDYKDGKKWVSEKCNQLKDYLLGYTKDFDHSVPALTTIIQPKTSRPVRSYALTVGEAHKHGAVMIEAAKRTDQKDAPLAAGKHCFWCKHKKNCDAQSDDRITKGAVMDNNIVEQVENHLQTMQPHDLSKILDAEAVVVAAFAKAKDEAKRRIGIGHVVPGYAVGPGSDSNVWNEDEETIAKKLKGMKVSKELTYPAKLISPAQARKLDITEKQKANLEKLITTVAGKDSLKKVDTPPATHNFFEAVPAGESVELPAPEAPTKFNFL